MENYARVLGKIWRRVTDPPVITALVVFYRGLATMLNAGVPLTRSLAMLGRYCENLAVAEAVQACTSLVDSGHTLSRAMLRSPHVFSLADAAMIAIGEQTGAIHRVVDRLARQSEQGVALRNRLKSALIYPLLVFSVCLVMLIAVPGLAFDGLLRFFEEMNLELPWSTKLMLLLCRIGKSPWFWLCLVAGVSAAGYVVRRAWDNAEVRLRVDELARAVPVLGTVVSIAAAGEFCRLLGGMHETGIPLLKALEIAGGSNPSPVLRQAIRQAGEDLRQGQTLTAGLRRAGGMPPMVYHMFEAGEQSGQLALLLECAARMCDESLEESLVIFEGLLQPVMLGFMGVLAGFVVLATMSPMIQLAQTL